VQLSITSRQGLSNEDLRGSFFQDSWNSRPERGSYQAQLVWPYVFVVSVLAPLSQYWAPSRSPPGVMVILHTPALWAGFFCSILMLIGGLPGHLRQGLQRLRPQQRCHELSGGV
jgi:hypothetical protein